MGWLWGTLWGWGGAGGERVGRGPLKSMGRPDGCTATVGLGGSVGLGGIYGASYGAMGTQQSGSTSIIPGGQRGVVVMGRLWGWGRAGGEVPIKVYG